MRKMEERNVSISNAKTRWNFLKKQSWNKDDEAGKEEEDDDGKGAVEKGKEGGDNVVEKEGDSGKQEKGIEVKRRQADVRV